MRVQATKVDDLAEREHNVVVLRSGSMDVHGTVLGTRRHVFSFEIDGNVANGSCVVRKCPGFVALMIEDVDVPHLGPDEYELKT